LQKEFESTGYASWINSELYPDGQIYTKEYTEWLENKVKTQLNAPSFLEAIKPNPITVKDELIKIIAEYLESETNLIDLGNQMWVQFGGALNSGHFTHAGFCQEIAAEIAGKVLAVMEQKTEWDDAPSWAEYKTIDDDGTKVYWDTKPYIDAQVDGGKWTHRNARANFKEVKYHYANWSNSLEQRPK